MHRVLIVTDDQRLAGPLTGALAGGNVIAAHVDTDLSPIEEALSKGGADAVVVDTRTGPPADELLKMIREQSGLEEVPMIGVLSQSALSSLPLPALDDFVFEPISLPELVARVMTRLIKFQALDSGNFIRVGRLEVDIDNYKARLDRKTLDLTYKEFELLRFLITHRGRVFTREALLNRVWGYDYFGGARTVDVHIRRLRSKLGPYEAHIETVRNVGYRFSEDS
jgi:DNA-binding response OmpR family regulator